LVTKGSSNEQTLLCLLALVVERVMEIRTTAVVIQKVTLAEGGMGRGGGGVVDQMDAVGTPGGGEG
jgi:hypothetical protein